MFARFDENPAMTLRVIKETKRYGRTDARTDGQRENSILPTNKVCGGYKNIELFLRPYFLKNMEGFIFIQVTLWELFFYENQNDIF